MFFLLISGFAEKVITSRLVIMSIPPFVWILVLLFGGKVRRFNQEFFYWLSGKLSVLGLQLERKIPYPIEPFLEFSRKLLLLEYSPQIIKFKHRRFRDYFSTYQIISLLKDNEKDPKLRTQIAHELSKMKDVSCDVLVELVADENKQVRLACIDGLGKIGTAIAAQTLIDIYQKSGKGIREPLVDAIRKVNDFGAAEILKNFWKESPADKQLREAIVQALIGMNKLKYIFNTEELEEIYEETSNDEIRNLIIAGLIYQNKENPKELARMALNYYRKNLIFSDKLIKVKSDYLIECLLILNQSDIPEWKIRSYRLIREVFKNKTLLSEAKDNNSDTIDGLKQLLRFHSSEEETLSLKAMLREGDFQSKREALSYLNKFKIKEFFPEILAICISSRYDGSFFQIGVTADNTMRDLYRNNYAYKLLRKYENALRNRTFDLNAIFFY